MLGYSSVVKQLKCVQEEFNDMCYDFCIQGISKCVKVSDKSPCQSLGDQKGEADSKQYSLSDDEG